MVNFYERGPGMPEGQYVQKKDFDRIVAAAFPHRYCMKCQVSPCPAGIPQRNSEERFPEPDSALSDAGEQG